MTDHDAILETLGHVRRRWRIRLLLEGLGRVLIVVVGLVLLWSVLVELGFGPRLVAGARTALVAVLVVGLGWTVWRAFRPRADLPAVALYLEENEPTLGQAGISAVHSAPHAQDGPQSPALVARLQATARAILASVDEGRRVERPRLRRASGTLALFSAGTVVAYLLAPAGVRSSVRALFDPAVAVAAPAEYAVSVEPGNAKVPRGGAQEIEAALGGFTSELTELVFRTDSTGDWTRVPMEPDSAGVSFISRIFDIVRPTEYFVEAEGVRSPLFRLDVVDLPTVQGLSALVQFPAYTGLAAESIEAAGDLAVLKGSTVTLHASTTRPARAAYLVLGDGKPVAMRQGADGRYSAPFQVRGDGFYRIELETEDGRRVPGTLQFAIDALDDASPAVRFAAPGRDTKVTSIEEVTAQIEASDDFGVRTLTLHVSVNGGEEQVVTVIDSSVAPRREASAAHTFFLEEWTLSPGDVVSYFARARDGAGQESSSDIYFLEIRPFDRSYREAEQGGMPGGGGGASAEGLSERQRQIVVATFNVLRDSAEQEERVWRENVTTLAIGEGRLREEVTGLVARMRERRLTAADSTFQTIARELDSALARLTPAEENLGRQRPRAALPDEQRALQHLQRAEAAYREVQVQRGQQTGGGGQSQSSAEDLADLFELETDKLRNQYESVQRESAAEAERQVDETLERLRRLASRQQQENERMQRMADAMGGQSGSAGGGGGAAQRELAREAEEAARQLERLARERNDPAMGESARRLREAAEAMRRAAGSASEQGAAQGNEAMERLRSATRELERARTEGRREELRRLSARADELRRKQAEIADQANNLPQDPRARADRAASIAVRKDALARDVERLEADAGRAARDAGRDQPRAAQQLAGAADGLRENRVRDKILFSKSLLRGGSPEYVRSFEEQIGRNLQEAAEQLRGAESAFGESGETREQRALERARELVRGLESLRDRAQAAQNRGRQEQAGEGRDAARDGSAGQRAGETPEAGSNDSTQRSGGGQRGEGREQQGGQQRGGEQRGDEQRGGEQQGGQQQGGRRGGEGAEQPSGRAVEGTGTESRGQPQGSNSPGRLDPNTARQFAREFRARRQVAESLRTDLQRLGEDVAAVDRVLEQFRALDDPTTFGDVRGLGRLEEELIENLKNLEFSLWRKYAAESGQQPALGASARVPPQYRELVEEYYRSLARRKADQR